jgi:hypothetical protein
LVDSYKGDEDCPRCKGTFHVKDVGYFFQSLYRKRVESGRVVAREGFKSFSGEEE